MQTAADGYKLSIYGGAKLIHETEACRVELVKSSLDGREYIKRSYRDDKRRIFEALRKIDSPYIPKIYEIIFGEDTVVIEEYAKGENLGELAKRGAISGKALLRAADELLLALQTLHENKIIHRDVKPENIIVTPDGIKLIDYGIARLYDEDETRDTEPSGTRGYAAPEQYGFAQTGPQADLYAFGKTIEALSSGLRIDGALAKAAAKCARFDPDDRFADAAAVRRYIWRRRKLRVAAAAAFIICAAAAAVFAVLQYRAAHLAFTGDITDGQAIERVLAMRPKAQPVPALLLNWTNDRRPQSGTIKISGRTIRVTASLKGDTLHVSLSDGAGHEAERDFTVWKPIRDAYAGDLHFDAEVAFRDINGDGELEILPAIAERLKKIADQGQFLGYWTNRTSVWCIMYKEDGFYFFPEQIDDKGYPIPIDVLEIS